MNTETSTATAELQEIRDELRTVARAVLAKTEAHGPDRQELARHGWSGLEIPEELGGAGVTFAETAVVLEELGRAATTSEYLGTVLAVAALNAATGPLRDDLLTAVAAGDLSATLALPGDAAEFGTGFHLRPDGDGWILTGSTEFVPDAHTADRLLLIAADPAGTPVIVCAAAEAAGLTRTPVPVVDESRSLATVLADEIRVADADLLRFTGDPHAAANALQDRAALAVACDSLGIAEAMLAATVQYAGVREQFDRPIGSFQAVKHACADMFVRTEVARRLVTAAIDGDAAAVAMAASYACAAAVDVAGAAMQLHGGIGYTWESGIHRYLKRATLDRVLFGTPAAHRRRLAARYR
jgi:alkylation response protein AidB-like acyl-CoA dehydrogenase